MLVFAREYETLLWDVDLCTGVRCELPPLSDLVAFRQCNGAFFVNFSSSKKDHATYLVPIPPALDDVNLRQLPDRIPYKLPFAKARLVYEGKEALQFAQAAFGNPSFPPFFVHPSDNSVWLLDVNTNQFPKAVRK